MYSSERLKGIDVFVTVVDAGSFTAAAERLSLTNSAVGKAIARLESRLGARLFERSTRKFSLTNAGQAFHRTCVQVLGDLEEAEHGLKAEDSTPVGKLRLELPATYGKLRVMPLLFDFMDRFPSVQPQISFTDRYVDLVEESVDVAVRIGGSNNWPAPIGYRYLGHEHRIFCCAPGYVARIGGIPDSLDSLHSLDPLLYRRPDGSPAPWIIERNSGLIEHCFPQARMEIGNAEVHVEALVQGLGVAQLPTWVIQAQLERGELVEVMPSFAVRGSPLYLLWLRSRHRVPKVSLLLAHLADGLTV
jgi:DNA-binding transcriptional LysR family regulator